LRLFTAISNQVAPAVIAAGLPPGSVPDSIAAQQTRDFTGVAGVNSAIELAGITANKMAYSQAFENVFLASITVSGLAIFCTALSPNAQSRMTNKITAGLSNKKECEVTE
jgi:hypothetical protein